MGYELIRVRLIMCRDEVVTVSCVLESPSGSIVECAGRKKDVGKMTYRHL